MITQNPHLLIQVGDENLHRFLESKISHLAFTETFSAYDCGLKPVMIQITEAKDCLEQ